MSSGGQYAAQVPEGDPQSAKIGYNPKTMYAQTKREQLAITEMLAEFLHANGIHVHAMHPGWADRADTPGVRGAMPLFRALTARIVRDTERGADTVVWLGAAPESLDTTGRFWHDRRQRPTRYRFGAGSDSPETVRDLRGHLDDLASR